MAVVAPLQWLGDRPRAVIAGGAIVAAGVGTLVVVALGATSTLLEPSRQNAPSTLESIIDPAQALGLELIDVDVAGELGNLPAWRIVPSGPSLERPAPLDTWVILVHGQGGDRRDCLGASGVFDALGLTQLVVSWRNDGLASTSPDGLYHLGESEWRDIEAAVAWALEHGARRLVLFGFSMGGSIVATFLRRSKLAGCVAGVVLDAPVLDWRAVLRHGARRRRLPPALTRITARASQRRAGIDLDLLDQLRLPGGLGLPTLIFHGTRDQLVPLETSRRYVELYPELASLVEIEGARHGETWRDASDAACAALAGFLVPILSPPG